MAWLDLESEIAEEFGELEHGEAHDLRRVPVDGYQLRLTPAAEYARIKADPVAYREHKREARNYQRKRRARLRADPDAWAAYCQSMRAHWRDYGRKRRREEEYGRRHRDRVRRMRRRERALVEASPMGRTLLRLPLSSLRGMARELGRGHASDNRAPLAWTILMAWGVDMDRYGERALDNALEDVARLRAQVRALRKQVEDLEAAGREPGPRYGALGDRVKRILRAEGRAMRTMEIARRAGCSPSLLPQMATRGQIVKVGRGLYAPLGFEGPGETRATDAHNKAR